MKRSIPFVFFFALLAGPSFVLAGEQSDAAAKAKAVAPYVDEMTTAVAHIDLSRVDAGSLVETLARLQPDAKDLEGGRNSEVAKQIDKRLKAVLQAGVKDLYFTVSLGGPGPIPTMLAVLPLAATADEKAVRAALDIPAGTGRRVGDALVIRLPPEDNRPIEIHSSPRPELTTSFEAAGVGPVQAVLIPPAYTRRVVEELMPQLPKEVGGGPSSILTRGVTWAAVGIDLPPHLALHLVVKSDDAGAAEAMREKWAEILRLAGQREEIRKAVPRLDDIAPLLTPKVEGDRLVLSLDDKTAAIDRLVAAMGESLEQARDSARRAQSMNNLRQIALAMLMYNDAQKHFPASASCGPDGKPLLSWRVYVLPYIDQKQLFDQFHLNEPWDSPHNKALIEKMPAVFRSPKSQAEQGKTNYLAPVGNGALYSSSRDEPQIKDIKDGPSHTIMVVEVDDPHAVIWTKPDDLAFDPKEPKRGIGSLYEGGFVAAYCDGHILFLSGNVDPKALAAAFTRAGGEAPGPY